MARRASAEGRDGTATAARRAALEQLAAVLERGQPLDDGRAGAPLARLEARDRAFSRALALTTLRRLGEIDALIDARVTRPPAAAARGCLRLCLAELLFLATPAYAAIDAAVRLAKEVAPRQAGLVNAVGRRVAEQADGARLPVEAAARRNTPDWIWARLEADWGGERATAIAAAHLEGAPLDLTPKAGASGAAALAEALGGVATPTGSVRLAAARGAVTALPGYAEGEWWVQDAAAALPVRLAPDLSGARVLDLCAAPGGKTLQLAAAGARVTAVDVSEARLKRVAENLARTGLAAELVAADAAKWRGADPFDGVLLDAPCSALGTLRRHPDVARIRRADDLAALSALQDRLLDAAWRRVRPGGWLVYCTCSLARAEGGERVEAFLARTPSAEADPIAQDALGDPALIDDGRLATTPADWPALGGLDGFFAARLRRRA